MSLPLARLARFASARSSGSLLRSTRRIPMLEPVALSAISSPTWQQSIRGKKTKSSDSSSSSSSKSKGKGRASSSADEEPVEIPIDWPTLFLDLETQMSSKVSHFAKELAVLENRASGRVNPSLLDPVRVTGNDGKKYKLNELATVGVKEGTTLVITLFDEAMLRKVEQALYAHKIPGVIPQVASKTVIRIPIPKPTVESRQSFVKEMAKIAEASRISIRGVRETALKSVQRQQTKPFDKNSTEAKKLQTVTDKHIKQIDDQLKKTQSGLERL